MKYIYGDFTASKLLSKSCVFCVYNDARLFWALMNFMGHWTVAERYYINLIAVFLIYNIYKQQAIDKICQKIEYVNFNEFLSENHIYNMDECEYA